MFRKSFIVLALLMVGLVLAPAVLASPPQPINGRLYGFTPIGNWCLETLGPDGEPDGFMDGCVDQSHHPNGYGERGTFYGTVDGKTGTCQFNIRTWEQTGYGIAKFNRCTDELAGLHFRGVASATPPFLWEGTYHFHP